VRKDLSHLTVYLVGNAHMDLVYRWRQNETVLRIAPDTFSGVLDLMERYPEVTFAQSQMALYEAMRQHQPRLFDRIRKAISRGRWGVVGGWIEYDHALTGDESIVRQYLLAGQYIRRHGLGDSIVVDWCPDSFAGHVHTLPSIMAGCGIRYLLIGRATPPEMPVFWWEGPDGSRVLCCRPAIAYSAPIGESILESAEKWYELTGLTDVLHLYGAGDHGGGPRESDMRALAELTAREGAPHFVHGLPLDFMQVLEEKAERNYQRSGKPGVYKGELPDRSRGAFTSGARNKRQWRALEHSLLVAERLAVFSALVQRKPVYPRVDLDGAWEAVLRHQFHDDSPGTSRRPVYLDNAREAAEVQREVQDLIDTAIAEVGARLDTRGDGEPLIVFNPAPWPQSAPVKATVRLAKKAGRVCLEDEGGDVLPAQVLSEERRGPWYWTQIQFTARDLPSVGYRLYRLYADDERCPVAGDVKVGASSLENEYLSVKLDPESGDLVSVVDKRSGREVLAGPSNSLQLMAEDPRYASAWVLWLTGDVEQVGPGAELGVTQRGPALAALCARNYYRSSYFEREVSLCSGLPIVFFRLRCHWYERDTCLKASFRLALGDAADTDGVQATFDVPFGTIARPRDGQEVVAHRWADLSGPNGGAAILNQGIYGHDVDGNTLCLTLLRGVGDLDPTLDEGEHEIVYALYPHDGDWRAAEVVRRGLEFNLPVVTRQEMKRSGILTPFGAPGLKVALDPSLSLVQVKPENVVLTALKLEQDQWSRGAMIMRLYEAHGQPCTARITLPEPVALVQETNHVEEPKEEGRADWQGNEIFLEFAPHEIRTIRVALAVYGLGLDPEATDRAHGLEGGAIPETTVPE